MEDSGRYTMIVQNKYGGESVDIVVSVTAVHNKLQDFLRAVNFSDHLWHNLGTNSENFCGNAELMFDLVCFVQLRFDSFNKRIFFFCCF